MDPQQSKTTPPGRGDGGAGRRESDRQPKFRLDRRMIQWGVTAFAVGLALIIVIFLTFRSNSIRKGFNVIFEILNPVFIGAVIAFILTPVVNRIERRWFAPLFARKGIDIRDADRFGRHARLARGLSIAIAIAGFLTLVGLLLVVVFPQLWESVMTFISNLRAYATNLETYASRWLEPYPEVYAQFQVMLAEATQRLTNYFNDTILPRVPEYLDILTRSIRQVLTFLLDVIVGIVVGVYLLGFKERLAGMGKKFLYAFLRERHANRVVREARFVNRTFTGFLVGKIIDSLIIGVICYAGCLIFKFPYAILISAVVGVTNIIPYFGPYIGGAFGAVVLVMIRPLTALYFVIFILVLQQFDGNILGPRILGNSIGIPSFWVLFSILLFGGLFGLPGMIFGVPSFAVFYHLMGELLDWKLRRRSMETKTEEYIRSDHVENRKIRYAADKSEEPVRERVRFPKQLARFFRPGAGTGKDKSE